MKKVYTDKHGDYLYDLTSSDEEILRNFQRTAKDGEPRVCEIWIDRDGRNRVKVEMTAVQSP